MIDDDDNDWDFDPYEWLLETSMAITKITDNHNKLVNDYAQVKKRVSMLERQLVDVQIALLNLDEK